MAESSEKEPKLSLRLIVDEEKNKLVLAEAGKDFVEVLFSILTLPIGTIVRLLENHRKKSDPVTTTVGCFNNLYKSVVEMNIDNFETEECKEMLVYPRSLRDVERKNLKLDINPTEGNKFYKCPKFVLSCYRCSNFSISRCRCGNLMDEEIRFEEEPDQVGEKLQSDGVFIRGRSSFIITDDLKVSVDSSGLVLKTLNRLGCVDVSKLGEQQLDIGLEEVLTLLECIFSSDTSLTDAFLKKQSLHDVTQISNKQPLSQSVKEKEETDHILTLDVIVRKQDMKILYVECCEDFVDLLFTFLALPLESILEITFAGNDLALGCCIGNLYRSFKDLSSVNEKKTEVSSSSSKCVLPHFYRCQKQFLDITFEEPPVYYRFRKSSYAPYQPNYSLTTNPKRNLIKQPSLDRLESIDLIDPKSRRRESSKNGTWFVKRETRFAVTDDLIITPRNSLSTSIGLLKKFQIQADDVEVQVISIGKTEAMSLLRASLVTSSALNTSLWNLIAKKPKEET